MAKVDPYYWISLDAGEATVKSGNEFDDPAAADQRYEAGNCFRTQRDAWEYAEMINMTLQAREQEQDRCDCYDAPNIKRAGKGRRYYYLEPDAGGELSSFNMGVEPITSADRHAAAGNYFLDKKKAQAAADALNELRRKLSTEIE